MLYIAGGERFGDEIVHAGSQATGHLVIARSSAHGNNQAPCARPGQRFECPDFARGVEAVEHGHLAVHEHDIEGIFRIGVEGFLAVGDQGHLQTQALEHLADNLLVCGDVFRYQRAESALTRGDKASPD